MVGHTGQVEILTAGLEQLFLSCGMTYWSCLVIIFLQLQFTFTMISVIYIMSQDPLNCTEIVVIKFRSKLGMLYITLLNHNHS